MHVVEVQLNQALIEITDPGITHRGQDATQVGVAGKEGCFDQGRMRDRISHLAALVTRAAALNLHRDELGGTFAVAHDGMRQLAGHLHQALQQSLALDTVERGDGGMPCFVRGHQHERVVG